MAYYENILNAFYHNSKNLGQISKLKEHTH